MARKVTYKRRPNNSGTVVKLSGKRRKPYCAKITSEDYDLVTGKKKQVTIGTFETELEALNALSLYHLTNQKTLNEKEASALSPDLYDQIKKKRDEKIPTFKEIFNILNAEEFTQLSYQAKAGYNSWIKHFEQIYDEKINKITLQELQIIFDNDKCGQGTKMHMKALCAKIFRYAVIHQYISRDDDYIEFIKCGKEERSKMHYAFSIDEIKRLKDENTDMAKIVLIYIYSGLRANELLNIDRNDIHIDEICNDDGIERKVSYFYTGSKTSAGKNRIVPIHDSIKEYVIELLLCENKRLIDRSYVSFNNICFLEYLTNLNMKHTIHDTRVTFTTLCQLNNVDVFSRKRVLGHKMKDITFDTYTDTVINKLFVEINKIKA
ncbi:hypothetical protein DWX05_11825 [Coprobacillus sp. AF18-15LB]|nr:hypothetical protein DWX19_01360 [Coprobacillus sp. AF18-40]RGT82011.1 hypothetical protein DWX05_11825 [Coprobacillus sp. AF18-15LB]